MVFGRGGREEGKGVETDFGFARTGERRKNCISVGGGTRMEVKYTR